MNSKIFIVVTSIICISLVQQVAARPNRIKRQSDTYLANLQTQIALNDRVRGSAVRLPVGLGVVDPARIGRRRRSQPDDSLEKAFQDLLQRELGQIYEE